MLIGMLMTLAIIGLLYAGPSFDNTLVAIAVYGGIILGMIAAWWYMHNLSGGVADFMLGGIGGKAKLSFDRAEKFESEHRFKEAIELYKQAIEKAPKDPEPRKRLANVYHTLKDYDNCIKYLHEALDLPKGMEEAERCTLMNRIADMHLQHRGDRAAAVRILTRLINEFPKSRYAVFARERIARIKRSG